MISRFEMRSVKAVVCVKEYVIAEISISVLMESHSGKTVSTMHGLSSLLSG